MVDVYGAVIDQETRCIHYSSKLDIVALKCFSCRKYYPCYRCHDACENHGFDSYPLALDKDKVVFCGACRRELTIAQYRTAEACPFCHSSFNPGCKLHQEIYFRKS